MLRGSNWQIERMPCLRERLSIWIVRVGGYAKLAANLKVGYPNNPELMEFLLRMFHPDPNKRPSVVDSRDFMRTQV